MDGWQKNIQSFNGWLEQPIGKSFLQQQKIVLNKHFRYLEGDYLLSFHNHHYLDLSHKFNKTIRLACFEHQMTEVVAAPFALPFTEASMDAVFLPHVLEFVPDLQPVFEECMRVLKPEGHIIITGLNKLSFVRWQQRHNIHWQGMQLLNLNDLQRELFLQGFDVIEREKFAFTPLAAESCGYLDRCGSYLWPFLGNGFVLTMQKRVMTPRLIKAENHKDLKIKNIRLANAVTERNPFE